jgi:nitroreductase
MTPEPVEHSHLERLPEVAHFVPNAGNRRRR